MNEHVNKLNKNKPDVQSSEDNQGRMIFTYFIIFFLHIFTQTAFPLMYFSVSQVVMDLEKNFRAPISTVSHGGWLVEADFWVESLTWFCLR